MLRKSINKCLFLLVLKPKIFKKKKSIRAQSLDFKMRKRVLIKINEKEPL
jgi:uncharacterized protein YrrD